MRVPALLTALLLLATPALAEPPQAEPAHYVDLSPLALPVIVQGRVKNYVFVYVRLDLTRQADANYWQDREPYFRDALVRAAHRTPFSVPTDWSRLDEGALKRSLFFEASKITGPGVVTSVEVLKATPQRRIVTPRF